AYTSSYSAAHAADQREDSRVVPTVTTRAIPAARAAASTAVTSGGRPPQTPLGSCPGGCGCRAPAWAGQTGEPGLSPWTVRPEKTGHGAPSRASSSSTTEESSLVNSGWGTASGVPTRTGCDAQR